MPTVSDICAPATEAGGSPLFNSLIAATETKAAALDIPPLGNLPPILALALDTWSGQWMNRQQLLSRLAAGGADVVYSAGQWTVWDRQRQQWRQAPALGGVERRDGVRIDQAPKWLPRFPSHRVLDAVSLRLGCARLRRLAASTRQQPPLLYLFHPAHAPYARRLAAGGVVYHAYDLFERTPGWTEELDRLERRLLREADLCIASSELTAERLQTKGNREVRFLPNGADVGAFAHALNLPCPADLAAIPHPRIGYTGRLSRKVDFGLLATLAKRNPTWQFVLLGPPGSLDAATREVHQHCQDMANIHVLGPRDRREVPAYVAGLDVGIIAYRTGVGLWSEACYPLKFHEYLAAGCPVVSVPLQALEAFAGVVKFASSIDQWELQIGNALAERSADFGARLAVAAGNDWNLRAAQLAQWLLDLAAQRRAEIAR